MDAALHSILTQITEFTLGDIKVLPSKFLLTIVMLWSVLTVEMPEFITQVDLCMLTVMATTHQSLQLSKSLTMDGSL